MQFVTDVITSMPIAYIVKSNKAIKLNQPNIPPIRSVVFCLWREWSLRSTD